VIAGTEGASAPFVSPDGRWIGFYAAGALRRVSVEGGASIPIAETQPVWSASWGANDAIVFAASAAPGGLWLVPASGGGPERITTVDTANGEIQHGYPRHLPNGDVLFSVITDRGWHFAAVTPSTKQVRALGQPGSGGAGAHYVASGHLLYTSGGGFVAVPFNPITGATGSPIPLLERPDIDPSGGAAFAVSASGTLAYLPRPSTLPTRSLVQVDRTGRATLLSDQRGAFMHPRLSRDGHRLAVAVESDTGSDVWVYDLERRSRTRLTTAGVNSYPIWSHDGQRVTYQSARSGGVALFSRNADGTGEAERLIHNTSDQSGLSRSLVGLLPGSMPTFTASNPHVPMSWSPNGKNLAFDERKPSAERDIWILPSEGAPYPFLVTPFDEFAPAFSPDGNWLAYVSDESGRSEVYVQPFPGPGAKWLISTDGGTEPAWAMDARELFFRRGDVLMSAAISTVGAELKPDKPKSVFEARYATIDGARNYDVVPDKPAFVAVRNDGSGDGAQFNVVLNWFTELKGRR
jgi:eukaryotic-like serine/threonine-protein kinase